MTSQSGTQASATHTLTNASRSKDNQAMKFGQLIEYNIRNIFLENDIQSVGRNYSRPFSKKSKLSISLNELSKVLYSLPLLYVKLRTIQNILKLSWRPLAFNSYNAFLKNKKWSGTSLPVSFFT